MCWKPGNLSKPSKIFTPYQHDAPQKNALTPPPRLGDAAFGVLLSPTYNNSIGAVHFCPPCIENRIVITNIHGFSHFSNMIRWRKMNWRLLQGQATRLSAHLPATWWGWGTSTPDALKTTHSKQTFTDIHTLAIWYSAEKCIDASAKATQCVFRRVTQPNVWQLNGGGTFLPPLHWKPRILRKPSRIFTLWQHDTPQKNALLPLPRPGNASFSASPSPTSGNWMGAVHCRPQWIEN